MQTCPACGRENPGIATRCNGCDRLLPVREDPRPAPAARTATSAPSQPEAGPDRRGWSKGVKVAVGGAALAAAVGIGALVATSGGGGGGGGGGDGDPTAASTTTTVAPIQPLVDGDPVYESCDVARASGATPLRAGDPGYRPGLDNDHDGLACE